MRLNDRKIKFSGIYLSDKEGIIVDIRDYWIKRGKRNVTSVICKDNKKKLYFS